MITVNLRSKRVQNDTDERGAVLLEFALLAPILVALVFVAVEIGFAWETSTKAETSVAGAARVAAQSRDNEFADYEVLRSVRGGLGDRSSDIERVVIFRSTAAVDVPASCLNGSALANGGVGGVCTVYSGSDVATLVQADFLGNNGCPSTPAFGWCPQDRVVTPGEFIGVYVVVQHNEVVGMLPGGDQELVAVAVSRIEPRA